MATHFITGSAQVQDGGMTIYGGTIVGSRMSTRGVSETAQLGTPVLTSSMDNLHAAISGGNFALMTKGKYVVKRVTTELAGSANTALLSGSSEHGNRRSINYAESFAQTFLHSLTWTSDAEGMPTFSFTKSTNTASVGVDSEGRSTRTAPGELVYGLAQGAITDDYSAKTS